MRAAALGVVLVALTAAGCGGGGGPSAETQAWATSVCTDITNWRTEVQTIAQEATKTISSGTATRADVKAAIDDGLQASGELVTKLRALGPPPTDQGDDAKQIVESFASDVQGSVDAVQKAVSDLPDNPTVSQIVTGLSGLATSVQQSISSAGTALEQLRDLGGDLKEALDDANACKTLRGKSED